MTGGLGAETISTYSQTLNGQEARLAGLEPGRGMRGAKWATFGVCNNSPAESTSPENGWRWSVGPIPGRRRQKRGLSEKRYASTSRRAAAVALKPRGAGPGGAAAGADLGGSSKYSNESFEGRSGEGFHVNSS
ncbi:hypothetical protein QQF64_034520 [Cirrhinus molitorella]|uniref:Uncharacterized protein n=2 Tax=Cirrhinus molitorella TaxID=172907 RepID=A0AA88TLM9_9TELE|nr:hypothetical protein Q8A67_016835 [Cirrhinus molitorella]KAK2886002.1 hypothetical protein Q8A67_016839 [Cirrhinus molitorella]KAK2886007.1 hypothetical protein Q8A67_016844 [Cirrhinus molitorella]KAK2886011.1 hypothetical protein Q8A67_016848 [Cirrhinus molitorella]KAK2886015.1 hypothetical protein Q8A67_016852 [Cirrhinus molitorella]